MCQYFCPLFLVLLYLLLSSLTLLLFVCVVKRRPKLKSRHKARVEKAIEYALTIESWDDLVDPRTLAFYNLGLDPSPYVLHGINIGHLPFITLVLTRLPVLHDINIEGKKSKY